MKSLKTNQEIVAAIKEIIARAPFAENTAGYVLCDSITKIANYVSTIHECSFDDAIARIVDKQEVYRGIGNFGSFTIVIDENGNHVKTVWSTGDEYDFLSLTDLILSAEDNARPYWFENEYCTAIAA